MARTGRPRKPQSLHRLQGTYRADRDPDHGAASPPLTVGAPACPADLGADARAIWDEAVPQLLALGVLTVGDGGMLRMYCSALSLARKYDAIAAAEPMIETRAGPKPHPAGVEARKLHRLVERLANDLGLSWAGRARTGAASPQDEEARRRIEEAERFLFGPRKPFAVIEGGKPGP